MNSSNFETVLKGLPVLVTGHTGFTGGWLCLWLEMLGCRVTGLSLEPPTTPNLFESAAIARNMTSHIGDIRDFSVVKNVFTEAKPKLVFHLAAQPLVGQAFNDPCETIATNVLGTAHVLEAARTMQGVEALICVTTDKVYANHDGAHREDDALGGNDPYSASKACAELITLSYIKTLNVRGNNLRMATARGGNIIGGGDWSAQRIVPDVIRAWENNAPLHLRSPQAVRPWQHVLALVHGYLQLAAALLQKQTDETAWNFGPEITQDKIVAELVATLAEILGTVHVTYQEGTFPETDYLRLDSSKARKALGWNPPLTFDRTAELTAKWYRAYADTPEKARDITLKQIQDYRTTLGLQP